jgi:hypothetical protein
LLKVALNTTKPAKYTSEWAPIFSCSHIALSSSSCILGFLWHLYFSRSIFW